MTQGTQWPSFIIQGIILSANLYFLVESESGSNIWIFLSLLSVLSVFSLQTTSIGFLYLYPLETDKSENILGNAKGLDTWILRLLLMASLAFLYLGILKDYAFWNDRWLIYLGLVLIFLIPVIFNMGISDWMRSRANRNFDYKK